MHHCNHSVLYTGHTAKHTVEERLMLVMVKIDLKENADFSEVLENLDYDFKHPDIISTEIVDVITEGNEG